MTVPKAIAVNPTGECLLIIPSPTEALGRRCKSRVRPYKPIPMQRFADGVIQIVHVVGNDIESERRISLYLLNKECIGTGITLAMGHLERGTTLFPHWQGRT